MIVGIFCCAGRVADGQALCAALAIDDIIGIADDIKMAHFMYQGAGFGIGTGQTCSPERFADPDLVGLIRVNIGEVVLIATAVNGDLAAGLVHGSVNFGKP